jgi:hypothetical protein
VLEGELFVNTLVVTRDSGVLEKEAGRNYLKETVRLEDAGV